MSDNEFVQQNIFGKSEEGPTDEMVLIRRAFKSQGMSDETIDMIFSGEDIEGTEGLKDLINVSVKKLIDSFAKAYRKMTKSTAKDLTEMSTNYKKAMKLWEERSLSKLDEIEQEDFDGITIGVSFDKKTYSEIVTVTNALWKVVKNPEKDILTTGTKLESKGIKEFVAACKKVGYNVVPDNRMESGYFFGNKQFLDSRQEDASIKDLGFTKADIKGMVKTLNSIDKQFGTKEVNDVYKGIVKVFDNIEDQLRVLYRNNDNNKNAKKIQELTLQMARAYFYLDAINVTVVMIGWHPFIVFTRLVSAVEDYLMKKK